ncbi:NAD-dependent 4,6-dehydratase LegB [Laribacter hongkongensis]|uniref:NAD-dependent 4,6-dehydratase LegB n=1 Tax=Laribacter hongkongensis TaxID=168471 RepID=UPI001EFEAD4A|nr:NAD-dependent 4,6-dehydratase LegB [Laribacter hongkongensis]MCG8995497.1 NAD-dependent 4,6-dehydratase LegB [Laribacter hongkongensis]MCG9010314.1 NAD-dependent 4,6-dehydratase LegB [Laribacter hongkongensis]MCG9046208.1 NAD-dependent 4,6-dehydratase LegB [Laribacter hongkongensis]MCG9051749.1 NAD-dependent 4,6-dehydratase LegB [Laribacter hongkongensis]MCG9073780.1 NAD-dependent 4,6-dehydratase LegB [Laribacter hongkongensis]
MKTRKILVTGADGFIGSHLTEALVRQGHDVRAFTLYNSFSSWGWLDSCADDVRGKFEVFQGDVRDPNGVRTAMQGCDAVLHLAALIAIPYSYHSPDTYVDTNVKGTLNVLQAARDLGVSRLVHTSTSEVYGTACFVPITEQHPLKGQSPYSATKIAADQLAYSYFASFGLPVVIARPFNTYGPRQSARAVIPTIITQIANGVRRLRLGAVSPTRDFNYVADTVAGFIAAMQSDAGLGEVVNFGSNFEISVGDTARLIAEVMQAEIEIETDEARLRPTNSEVERLWADNAKAKDLFGWAPAYGAREGFARGIGETVQWFTQPANLARYKAGIYNI